MRRLMIIGLLGSIALAGTFAPTGLAAASAGSGHHPKPRPNGPSLATIQNQFLSATATFNAANGAFSSALSGIATSGSLSGVGAAVAPLAAAFTTYQRSIAAIRWSGVAKQDAASYLKTLNKAASFLATLPGQRVAGLSSWSSRFSQLATAALTADNLLRHDIGLPPTSSPPASSAPTTTAPPSTVPTTQPPATVPTVTAPPVITVPTTAPPAVHTITYQLTGQSRLVGVTYTNSDSGNTVQVTNVALPLTYSVQLSSGRFYSVLAQDVDASGVSITCTVLEDGTQIAQNTSTGPGSETDCHGTVP